MMLPEWNRYLAREWPQYIVGSGVGCVAWHERHPVDAGVYFMFTDDLGLTYVGMSLGISYRITQHYWAGRRCAYYGAVAVPGDLMHAVETAYIDALRPPLNRKFDRPAYPDLHAKMVMAINDGWVLEGA